LLRWARRALVLAALLAVALVLLYATRERTLNPLAAWALPRASRAFTPFEVRVDAIEGDWVRELSVRGLVVERLGSESPLRSARAERAEVSGDLLRLARSGDLAALASVRLVAPRVTIDLDAPGSPDDDEPAAPFAIPPATIERGTVVLDGAATRVFLEDIEAVGRASDASPLEVSLRGSGARWSALAAGRITFDGEALGFEADLEEASVFGAQGLRAAGVAGRWSPEGLRIDRGEVVSGGDEDGNRATVRDLVLADGTLGAEVDLQLGDLESARGTLAALDVLGDGPAWSGSAEGSVSLAPDEGTVTRPTRLEFTAARLAVAGAEARSLEASLDSDAGGALRVVADGVVLPVDRVGRVDAITAEGQLAGDRLSLEALRASTRFGDLRAALELTLPSASGGEFAVDLSAFELTRGDARIELEAPARVAASLDGDVRVDDLRLGGTIGRLELDATSGPRGTVLALDAERFDVTPFVPEVDESLREARVRLASIDGHLDLETAPLRARGDVAVEAIVRRAGTSESVRVAARGQWTGERVALEALEVSAAALRADLRGEVGLDASGGIAADAALSVAGEVRADETVLRHPIVLEFVGEGARATLERLEGDCTLGLDLDGTPSRVAGTLRLDAQDGRLARAETGDGAAAADGAEPTALPFIEEPLALSLRARLGEQVELEESTLRLGDEVASGSITGSIGRAVDVMALAAGGADGLDAWREAPLDLRVDVSTDELDRLRTLVPELRETGGHLEAHATLQGTLSAPVLGGGATLSGGTARYRGAPPIEALELEVVLEDDQVRIARGELEVGSAPVTVEGNLLLGQDAPRIDATVRGKNVLLVRSRDARLRADVDLDIEGRVGDLRVTGLVDLVDGRVRSPIEFQSLLEGGGAAPPSVTRGLRLPAIGPRWVKLDARVRTSDRISLRGRIARGGLRSELRLRGDASRPLLEGSLFLDPLELAVPAGTIRFASGLVSFPPTDPEIPRLDLVGETRLAGYDVTVVVEGEYDRAEVQLSSSPPLPPEDLLLLVLTGQPPSQGTGLSAAGQSVALYVARDLVTGWFSSGGFEDDDRRSFLDRLEVTTGRDVSRSGVLTVEATYLVREGLARDKDAIYIVAERDAFEDYGMGLRLVLRLD